MPETSASTDDAARTFTEAPGWVCHRVELDPSGDRLRIGFSRRESSSWVEIDIWRPNPVADASGSDHCRVDHHGEFGGGPSDEREALALVARVASLVDDQLTEMPARGLEGARSLFTPATRAVSTGSSNGTSDVPTDDDLIPAESSDGRVILSLSSPCHQTCSFCSLKTTWQTDEGVQTMLARVVDELRAGRARGADAFTLNGFDPLSFAKILDVLDAANALGYQHIEVYSPCTLLADRDFCAALVARLPASRRVHVPLYALDASVHDAIVGRAGSFSQVMTALEHLITLIGPQAITITTVSTRDNLHLLPALFRFGIERGLDVFSTMPYPATNAATDRFVDASPRQSDAAALLVDALADAPEWIGRTTVGIAPCVIFARARARGIPLQRWLAAAPERPRLNGGPLPRKVPCRHAATCVLADACPGELFERYVACHGDDEFQPVRLYDLLRAAGAADGPSEGSSRRELGGRGSVRAVTMDE